MTHHGGPSPFPVQRLLPFLCPPTPTRHHTLPAPHTPTYTTHTTHLAPTHYTRTTHPLPLATYHTPPPATHPATAALRGTVFTATATAKRHTTHTPARIPLPAHARLRSAAPRLRMPHLPQYTPHTLPRYAHTRTHCRPTQFVLVGHGGLILVLDGTRLRGLDGRRTPVGGTRAPSGDGASPILPGCRQPWVGQDAVPGAIRREGDGQAGVALFSHHSPQVANHRQAVASPLMGVESHAPANAGRDT